MSVEKTHEEKETLSVDVNLPGHEARTTTSLFEHTRKQLLKRDKVCFICGCENGEDGPLEAHHVWVERCLAEMVDWHLFRRFAEMGTFGPYAKEFDWASFDPTDPYTFVDNMLANGMLLCAQHHREQDEGIHNLPFPLWIAQKVGKEGYKFSAIEIIHHE